MKTNYKLALAVLAGVSIGVAGAKAIQAQQIKTPPAYAFSEVDALQDAPALREYGQKVPGTLAPFNHRFIVAGGKTQALEGDPPKGFSS